MNAKQKIFIGLLALSAVALPAAMAYADSSGQLVNLNFPCPSSFAISGISGGCAQLSSSTSIGSFLNTFYQIALGLSGLLALVMIIYGGIEYSLSAGNVGSQEDARNVILSAIYGLVLLFASYLILNTINPQITTLYSPGQQFGSPPATALGGKSSPPVTECVPLNTQTADPSNPSVLSATVTYASTTNAKTWDGQYFRDDTKGCSYRTTYIGNKGAYIYNDNKYYDENESIPANSEVWQYPYFPGSAATADAVAAGARCLIYAYQKPFSSDITMIKLNPTLQLCYPHNQVISASQQGGLLSNDQAVAQLQAAGVGISSSDNCSLQTDAKCTSLEGIPASTVQHLITVHYVCQDPVTVTGGTEVGHQTHGPGKPVVDLSFNKDTAECIYKFFDPANPNYKARGDPSMDFIAAVCTTDADQKYRYNCDSHDEKVEHLHIQFKP